MKINSYSIFSGGSKAQHSLSLRSKLLSPSPSPTNPSLCFCGMAGGSHHQRPSSHTAKPSFPSSSSHRKSNQNPPTPQSQPRLPTNLKKASDSRPSPAGRTVARPSPRPGPSPRLPLAGPSSPLPPPFADPMAALGPPPPPSYGFHMLDRRTIVLADGSVRSYFALPPDYQDFPTRPFPPRPELGMPQDYWSSLGLDSGRPGPSEGPGKRKLRDDRALEAPEWKRQQLAGPSRDGVEMPPFSRDGKFVSGNVRLKHLDVDQRALKKAFLYFVKSVNENPHQRKKYLENGRGGALKCLACNRFDPLIRLLYVIILFIFHNLMLLAWRLLMLVIMCWN